MRNKQTPEVDEARAVIEGALSEITLLIPFVDEFEKDPAKFESHMMRFETLGVLKRDVDRFKKAVRDAARKRQRTLRAVTSAAAEPLAAVKDSLPAAPVPIGTMIPRGYALTENGISRACRGKDGDSVAVIAPCPIVISARFVDIETDQESVRLAWYADDRWHERTVDRATIADANQLVKHAAYGLPVTSNTAKGLVDFLAAFEAENRCALPRERETGRLGWVEAGDDGFMWGRTWIAPDSDDPATSKMAFRGLDEGAEQLADAFTSAGTLEHWREAVDLARAYPIVQLLLLASLAAPLLRVLNVSSFIVDLSSPTSEGKTSALRLAGSAWGNPDETAGASVVGSWNNTAVYVERTSATLSGLPFLLDDTKQARDPREIARVVYAICGNSGRGRGSLRGTRRLDRWRTVMVSTGEQKITAFTSGDGGTHARVLCVWGSPTGHTSADTARTIRQINDLIRENYGHAGPLFVRYVLAHRDDWPKWRAEYTRVRERYASQFQGNPVADRLAGFAAVLHLAGDLAEKALGILNQVAGNTNVSPVEFIWSSIAGEGAAAADRATVALRDVLSWATGEQHRFWGRHDVITEQHGQIIDAPLARIHVPSGGWLGRWSREESWESFAVLPHHLRCFLEAQGYEAEAILRTWRDRGWLDTGKDRVRGTKKIRLGHQAQLTWAVVIRREAFDVDSSQENDSGGNVVGTEEPNQNEEVKDTVPNVPNVPIENDPHARGFYLDYEDEDDGARKASSKDSSQGGNSGNSGNMLDNQQRA